MKKIISNEENKKLLMWIKENLDKFKPNIISPHRNYLNLDVNIKFPILIKKIKKRILVNENISDYIDNSPYGDYIGYITNNGKIHRHIDPTIEGYDHIRFNLFLSIPEKGGMPKYNNEIVKIQKNEYIRCNSSKEFHECETVLGTKPRIVISYGIYVKEIEKNFFCYE